MHMLVYIHILIICIHRCWLFTCVQMLVTYICIYIYVYWWIYKYCIRLQCWIICRYLGGVVHIYNCYFRSIAIARWFLWLVTFPSKWLKKNPFQHPAPSFQMVWKVSNEILSICSSTKITRCSLVRKERLSRGVLSETEFLHLCREFEDFPHCQPGGKFPSHHGKPSKPHAVSRRTQIWPFGAPSTGSMRSKMVLESCAGTICKPRWRWSN